jgi:hypothetical protein
MPAYRLLVKGSVSAVLAMHRVRASAMLLPCVRLTAAQ